MNVVKLPIYEFRKHRKFLFSNGISNYYYVDMISIFPNKHFKKKCWFCIFEISKFNDEKNRILQRNIRRVKREESIELMIKNLDNIKKVQNENYIES